MPLHSHPSRSMILPGGQNLFDACLKVFFSLRPEPDAIDGRILFDLANPVDKLANILSRLVMIPLQIFGPGHCLEESSFLGALRQGARVALESEEPGVSGEEVLESQVDLDVTVFAPERVVVVLAIAGDFEWLRLDTPFP